MSLIRRKILIGTLVVFVLFIAILIVLVLVPYQPGKTNKLELVSVPRFDESVSNGVFLKHREFEESNYSGDDSIEELDIWEMCPVDEWAATINIPRIEQRWGLDFEVSNKCLTAREQYMLSRPFEPNKNIFRFVSFKEPRNLAQAFSDPEQDFANIVEALNQEECMTEGMTANWELKETCHAESFGNFAMFYDFCRRRSGAGSNITWIYETNYRHITDTTATLNEEMRENILNLWKKYLETSWFDDYCLQYDLSLRRITLEQHPELYEQLMEIGRNRVHFQGAVDLSDGDDMLAVHEILLSIGARLGDEAAALNYFPGPDLELREYFDEKQPWRVHWRTMWEESYPSVERLSAAMDLVQSMEENGVGYDMEWLVEFVCKHHRIRSRDFDGRLNPSKAPSCQTMIESLKLEMDPLDGRHPFLGEFERVAIEQRVFD
ncbi:MAG: hypothetical protein OXH84_08570 [Gammaproteobacteria bacterium]|nr:hypothetical protein [Gammaproteobacteria bacterium]